MFEGKSVVALVPARSGSKGIPGKNIRKLLDKPLIAWSIEAALRSRLVDRVIVSTDSEEIAGIGRAFGAEVPFLRPAELATDDTPSIEVILHALDFLERSGTNYDYLALLEPTSPLRDESDVDGAIQQLLSDKTAESIVGVAKTESSHPTFLSRMQGGLLTPYLEAEFVAKRRQDIDDCYFFEGSVYVSTVAALRTKRGFYHDKTLGYVVPRWKSYEVDEESDFVIVEALARAVRAGVRL